MASIPPDTVAKPGNKIIHLVRHAQGFHNLTPANHILPDPLLTDLGKQQCQNLSRSFPAESAAATTLLVASPLRRTIYTALFSFPGLTARGLRVLALPAAQETSDVPCDTGSSPGVLVDEFKDLPVDLSLVEEGWNSKSGFWAAEPGAVRIRAKWVREWLKQREERVIVLVSHGGFLHYLNEDWSGFDDGLGTGWKNCEWRSYEFSEGGKGHGLVETRCSRERRAGGEKPLGETEMKELERVEGGRL